MDLVPSSHPTYLLDYRHLVEYIMFVQSLPSDKRDSFLRLWNATRSYRWSPFYRLTRAAKALGVQVEDPFVMMFHGTAYSIDEPISFLKHSIRDSYRQLLLRRATSRRVDCAGPTLHVDVQFTRKFFLSLSKPLHKQMVRYFLTGALDHSYRLFRSNLIPSPICVYCNDAEETAQHIFWDCKSWQFIRDHYATLMRFYSLCGLFGPITFYIVGGFLEAFRMYSLCSLH